MGRRQERVLLEIPPNDSAPLWRWNQAAVGALDASLKYRGMKRVGGIDTKIHHNANAWIEAVCLAERDSNTQRVAHPPKNMAVTDA